MRKILALIVLMALVSCAPRVALPPPRVLENAVLESQRRSSLRLDVEFSLNDTVTGHASGVLQNAGNQTWMDLDLRSESAQMLSLRFIAASEDEQYVLIQHASSPSLSPLTGQWWSLHRSESGSAVSAPLSPDPKLLRSQISSVVVRRDHGFAVVDRHTVYHYDIELDKNKLSSFMQEVSRQMSGKSMSHEDLLATLQFTGECWIDAESFLLRRIRWDILSTDPQKPFHVQLTVKTREQNSAIAIEPPNNARPLPIEIDAMTDILNFTHP